MSESDKVFAGSIPELYDTFLVPLIFESFAADIAERTAALDPRHVLETAAGSGVLSRALAQRLPPDVRMTITDLNQPMIDHAARVHGEDARVSWRQADALALPFNEGTFDAVVCQFGVMFFPDKVAGYAEARRVLKPGGSFLFNTWHDIVSNEFADAVTAAAATVFPDDPPRFLARTPHGYHDLATIRGELEAAGFSSVSVVTVDAVSAAPSARHVAIAYCQGTPLRNEIEARDASRLEHVTDVSERAIAERFGEGPVSARICGHVFQAVR
jgi:ubiquinone/menaquinone biosynthesis C-methylase UbiE